MKQIAGVMLVAILLTLWAALPPEAGAFGGTKKCVKNPTNVPIGYPCQTRPGGGGCIGTSSCRWYVDPKGDCHPGNSKCVETDGRYEITTMVAPCMVDFFTGQCFCNANRARPSLPMTYDLDDCSG